MGLPRDSFRQALDDYRIGLARACRMSIIVLLLLMQLLCWNGENTVQREKSLGKRRGVNIARVISQPPAAD